MSNNKQNHIGEANKMVSSVEWLVVQLWEQMNMQGDGAVVNEIFEQAKAMHKEEIRKAYCYGEYYKETKLTTDYYNETFGGNNEQR